MRSQARIEATTRGGRFGGAAGLPPLPDVLAEPFWDPEPYRTREARETRRSALDAMALRMGEEGLPAHCFDEAIACLDEAGAAVA